MRTNKPKAFPKNVLHFYKNMLRFYKKNTTNNHFIKEHPNSKLYAITEHYKKIGSVLYATKTDHKISDNYKKLIPKIIKILVTKNLSAQTGWTRA